MEGTVGFRFLPTDEELINYFLRHKILGPESMVENVISEINIYKFDPWDLPWQSKIPSSDHVWFFFCPRDSKFSNSKRTCRTTRAGYWKATGVDRKIKGKKGNNGVIGTKKTLVFYQGRAPNCQRTSWVMHEYHPTFIPPQLRTFVICKVADKEGEKTGMSSCNGSERSYSVASESNLAAINTTFEVNQPVQENTESFHDYGLSDFELAVPLGEEEGLSLAELPSPNEITRDYNAQQPTNHVNEADQEFLNGLMHVDRKLVEKLFVDQEEFIVENSVHEHFSDYRPPKPLTGVYNGYSSDSDTETISAGSHQKISSPVGSSKEREHIRVCDSHGTNNDSLVSTNTWKSRYKSENTCNVPDENPTRLQLQGEGSRVEAPSPKNKTREASGPDSTVELSKYKKPPIPKWKRAKETSEKTSVRNGKEKGSCIFLETIEISRKPNMMFVHIMNVVAGFILLVVAIRGIMFFH